jgi:hypothetical protein
VNRPCRGRLSKPWEGCEKMQERDGGWSRTSSIVLGLLLIGAGLAFLLLQVYAIELPFDLGRVGWPLYVIVPGVVLLLVGLTLPDGPGIGLAVAGSIVATIGLVLAYQSAADHYSSWAYAWALVGPAAVGAGMLLWGILHLRGDVIRGGLGALGAGLLLFLIGFGFFEGVLNLGGDRGLAPLGRQALPLALIVAGVLVILTRLWPRRRDEWRSFGEPGAPPGRAPESAAPTSPEGEPRD